MICLTSIVFKFLKQRYFGFEHRKEPVVLEEQLELSKSFFSNLSDCEKRDFDSYVLDCCYDRNWCLSHNISYINPKIEQVRYFAMKELKSNS